MKGAAGLVWSAGYSSTVHGFTYWLQANAKSTGKISVVLGPLVSADRSVFLIKVPQCLCSFTLLFPWL